jgi:hypothetical protein
MKTANKLMLAFQMIALLNLVFVIAGCSSKDTATETVAKDADIESVYADNTAAVVGNAAVVNTESSASGEKDDSGSLSGTCPKGNHCFSPHCPLWQDADADNVCDRAA